LADRAELVAASRQHFVRICLVANVPEDLVARGVEQAVEGDGQLAGAEVGAEMPADLTDRVDDQLPRLLGELLELVVGELPQILRAFDRVEQALLARSVAL